MLQSVARFQALEVSSETQYRLAKKASDLRYGATVLPFPVEDLLHCRREDDRAPTLWNTFNRVQENAIYGGWQVKSAMWGRASAVRPVERVSAVTAINCGLWDEAFAISEEVSD